MNFDEIKTSIQEKAVTYAREEDWYAEILEQEVFSMISRYCLEKGYKVNEFPEDELTLFGDEDNEIEWEKRLAYICFLATEKEDVADLVCEAHSLLYTASDNTREEWLQEFRSDREAGVFKRIISD